MAASWITKNHSRAGETALEVVVPTSIRQQGEHIGQRLSHVPIVVVDRRPGKRKPLGPEVVDTDVSSRVCGLKEVGQADASCGLQELMEVADTFAAAPPY